MNYSTPPAFENANGQAYYNIINASFLENLSIPTLQNLTLTEKDKTTIDNHVQLLVGSMQNPLTWEHLLALEAQYLNWIDKTQRKSSVYNK